MYPENGSGNQNGSTDGYFGFNPVPSNNSGGGLSGETAEFLAILNGGQPEAPAQRPSYGASPYADSPAASPATSAAWQTGGMQPASTPAFAAAPAQDAAAGDAPVNPYLARRRAAGLNVTDETALYPIGEGGQTKGDESGFDTSFGRKQRVRRVVISVVVILVLVAIGLGVFFGIRTSKANEARASIKTAIETIYGTDGVVGAIDSTLYAVIEQGADVTTLLGVATSTLDTNTALTKASEFLSTANKSRGLLSTQDIEAIAAAQSSISARRQIISVARDVMSTSTTTASALTYLETAYANIDQALYKCQSAVDQVRDYVSFVQAGGNPEAADLWSIVALDQEAVANVAAAQAAVTSASQSYSGINVVDLSNFLNTAAVYSNMLVQYHAATAESDWDAVASIEPLLAQAKADMDAAHAKIPASAQTIMTEATTKASTNQRNTYLSAHASAVTADAKVCEYSGVAVGTMGITGALPSATRAAQSAQPEGAQAGPAAQPAVDQSVPVDGVVTAE